MADDRKDGRKITMSMEDYRQLMEDFNSLERSFKSFGYHFQDEQSICRRIGTILSGLHNQIKSKGELKTEALPGYTIEDKGGERIAVPDCSRITLGNAHYLEDLKKYTDKDLVLDISNIAHIDSTGLYELTAIRNEYVEKGKNLILKGVNQRIRDALTVMKLSDKFPEFLG